MYNNKPNIVVGIDVGTTKIRTIIAQVEKGKTKEIIGIGIAPSYGLKLGEVMNINETVESIEKSIKQAENMAGVEIEEAYIGIAGGHIQSKNSQGLIGINPKDPNKEIIPDDIERVINTSKIINFPPNHEIIHILTRSFTIDGKKGITEPLGMRGVRLEAETHIITGCKTAIQNLTKCVNYAGVKVKKLVLQPLATSDAILKKSEKELGSILVDIGGGTTDIAIFSEGSICHTAILPVGGDHVSKDISIGFKISTEEAEKIKIKYGSILEESLNSPEIFEVLSPSGKDKCQLSSDVLYQIIKPRIEEILELIWLEIEKADVSINSVCFTGGGSLLKGLSGLANEFLDARIRIGVPEEASVLAQYLSSLFNEEDLEILNINSLENNHQKLAIFSTSVGLIHYGVKDSYKNYSINNKKEEYEEEFEEKEGIIEKIKKIFNKITSYIIYDEEDTENVK